MTGKSYVNVLRKLRFGSWSRLKLDYVVLGIIVAAYIVSMTYLSFLKYYTFHATFFDLGINNEVLWLLAHGGVANYYASHFNLIYPIQYEKPIIFLITPLYYLYPKPEFLLFLQTFFLGITVFPVYIASKKLVGSRLISGVVASSFLGFFPVASANLFDFHFMSFFPFFYSLMVMFWSLGKRKLMILSALLTATVDPMTLLLALFFLLFTILTEFLKSDDPLFRVVFQRNLLVLASMMFLSILIFLYHLVGTLYTAGATISPNSDVIFFNINAKLTLFIFLFGFFSFLPLLEPVTIFLIAPYAGYVLLSTNSANYAIFGLMYPLLSVGPLLTGTILFMSKLKNPDPHYQIEYEDSEKPARRRRKIREAYKKPVNKATIALVVIMLSFTIVYFPLSPVNQYVQGGYFNGNHSLSGITYISNDVRTLHQFIGLIPSNASVLTQNDIPQLSGREYVATMGAYEQYEQNLTYDYILFDYNFSYFTNTVGDISMINGALASGYYGILAEAPGALLLERNYHSNPKIFVPYSYNFSVNTFYMGDHAITHENILTDNYSGGYMWYGPYVTLYPGTYNFTFYLSSDNVTNSSFQAITLDINSGPIFYSEKNISMSSFTTNNTIVAFTLTAAFSTITQSVEFRGIAYNGNAHLSLYSVNVTQLSA